MSAADLRARPSRRLRERAIVAACALAALLPIAALLAIVGGLLRAAAPRLSWRFIVGGASTAAGPALGAQTAAGPALGAQTAAETAGVSPALIDSLALVGIAGVIAVPIGLAGAIYLEEYVSRSRLRTLADRAITQLAGVPSVVYGLVGLAIFVRTIGLRSGLLAGGATLALVVFPAIVRNTRDALRGVSPSLREASYALGASRWRTIRLVVLPAAAPEIAGRAALTMTRAIGEAAPLLVVGALGYGALARAGEGFTALPVQIFGWLTSGDPRFAANAAAGMVVLLLLMLMMGGLGLYLRWRLARRLEL